MLPDLNIKASEAPYINIQIQRGFSMTDELIKHPELPTWPTPAAKILMQEADRLKKVGEGLKYDLSKYTPLQDTLDCILIEHKKWRESVMNCDSKRDEFEMHLTPLVPYRPLGGPVQKPVKIWKILILFEIFNVIVYLIIYFITKR